MAKQNPKWHRDEVILVLDLYYRLESGQMNASNPEVIKTSEILNKLPIHKIDLISKSFVMKMGSILN